MVEHQERVESGRLGVPEGAAQVDAGPLEGGAGGQDLQDRADRGHGGLLSVQHRFITEAGPALFQRVRVARRGRWDYNKGMKRLLIVEDEAIQGRALQEELRDEGYEADLVASGVDAVKRVQDHEYDCIILDIYLPGMDGLETMGRILSRDRQIPIILYSAYSSYRDNFLSWAADAYLIKSSDTKELKATIERLTASRPTS
jgi:CheY-like chemotaxis protein